MNILVSLWLKVRDAFLMLRYKLFQRKHVLAWIQVSKDNPESLYEIYYEPPMDSGKVRQRIAELDTYLQDP